MLAPARPATPRRPSRPFWRSGRQNLRDSKAKPAIPIPQGNPERIAMGSGGSQPLFGLMQDWPLTTDKFIAHAQRWTPRREVVSRQIDGQIQRRRYDALYADSKKISAAL